MKKLSKFVLIFLSFLAAACSSGDSELKEVFTGESGIFTIKAQNAFKTEFKDLGDVVVIKYTFSGEELRNLEMNVGSGVTVENSIGSSGQLPDGRYFSASFSDSFITLKHMSDGRKVFVFRETLNSLVIAVGVSKDGTEQAEAARLEKRPKIVF